MIWIMGQGGRHRVFKSGSSRPLSELRRLIDGANALAVLTDSAHSLVLVRIAAANRTRNPFFLVRLYKDFQSPVADYT